VAFFLFLWVQYGGDVVLGGAVSVKNCSGNELFQKAQKIYQAALRAVDPETLLAKHVSVRGSKLIVQSSSFNLSTFENIYLVAIGKAAPYMARWLLGILRDSITQGTVLYLPPGTISLPGITCLPSPHPIPDERSLGAAQQILHLAEKAGEKDLFLVLISGGGSAQITLPPRGISLEEKRRISQDLLNAGANITEFNIVRKHLSLIKGGRLAKAAYPARTVSLIISDVINNDLETIASGPTSFDSSTFCDAERVLQKYGLWDSAPETIKGFIKRGIREPGLETVKKDDDTFQRVSNFVIGDIEEALQSASEEARRWGFQSVVLTSSDRGEAREAAKSYASLLEARIQSCKKDSFPLCFLAGGELTVTVKGTGKGGRNQEFVLAMLEETVRSSFGDHRWVILSLGTDGIDGPTDAAGAWIGSETAKKTRAAGLDPIDFLDNNDSYHFFQRIGNLIVTGPTRTNVMDLRIFLFGE